MANVYLKVHIRRASRNANVQRQAGLFAVGGNLAPTLQALDCRICCAPVAATGWGRAAASGPPSCQRRPRAQSTGPPWCRPRAGLRGPVSPPPSACNPCADTGMNVGLQGFRAPARSWAVGGAFTSEQALLRRCPLAGRGVPESPPPLAFNPCSINPCYQMIRASVKAAVLWCKVQA